MPCRWWLIDGCKSLFNVKPSMVPTRLMHELYVHTRTAHPERLLGAETPRRPNIPQHLPGPRTGCGRVKHILVRGPARERTGHEIKNQRRQYGGDVRCPPYSGRGFLITVTVRRPAGPRVSAFRTAVGASAASLAGVHGWLKKPWIGGFHVAPFSSVNRGDLLHLVLSARSLNDARRRARAHQ